MSGGGFEPNVGVDIFFGKQDKALVVTNGKGEFRDQPIYAPRSAQPGKHWVTALERNNDKGAQKQFLVQTDWSQFHFDADGTRLNPYENVLNPKTVRSLELKWSYPTGYVDSSSPAIANGVLYVGGASYNSMYALNARTGTKLWSYRAVPGVFTSPAVADGVVYIGSVDWDLYALNASTGALVWSYATGGGVDSSAAVADGVVYVASWGYADNFVYALNARTGAELWAYATGYYVVSSPSVVNGTVYVGCWDDNVYAFSLKYGSQRAEAASRPPDLKTLRPDLKLKATNF